MRTLIGYYTDAVVSEYKAKKTARTLSLRLVHPTPAKLKEECKVVCRERFERKDYPILKTFFGEAADVKACLVAIGKCEIDKFKPLLNFINGKVSDPHPTNVELLAWLIDFKNRPFDDQKKYEVNASPAVINEEAQIQEEKGKERESDQEKEDKTNMQVAKSDIEKQAAIAPPAKTKITSKIIAAAVVLAILAPVIYLSIKPDPGRGKPQGAALTGHDSCMYWAGDHYQQISCSQKLGDTLIVALDSMKLNHFKKITQPDTITKNAIGYVWYVKINGSLELYTADGNHPVHQEYRLRPITLYMINKYIKPGGQSE